jgi:SAM-dependent methyltransferase
VARWLPGFVWPETRVLEVGTGASIFAEWLLKEGRTVERFVATDLSQEMLEYSRSSIAAADCVLCDARRLAFLSESFDIVVSSLGDPYNTPQFWKEAARVLRVGGHVLFTTPSFEWALKFRGETDAAAFVVSDGSEILLPSYVKPDDIQGRIIEASGFMLVEIRAVEDTDLRETVRSPRLRPGRIVSGYLAEKRTLGFSK